MMIGYINNSEIADGEQKVDESVNMQGTVESNAVLESEEDKQHRMDNELKTKFNVKNTEERIRRLKEVLGLLRHQKLSLMIHKRKIVNKVQVPLRIT